MITSEDQTIIACNLELSKKLNELGVKQDSHYYWINTITDTYEDKTKTAGCTEVKLKKHKEEVSLCSIEGINRTEFNYAGLNWSKYFRGEIKRIASAFTVAELGVRLPEEIYTFKFERDGSICWCCLDKESINSAGNLNEGHSEVGITEADAKARMLSWWIENGRAKEVRRIIA